jgi:hypothetical protein
MIATILLSLVKFNFIISVQIGWRPFFLIVTKTYVILFLDSATIVFYDYFYHKIPKQQFPNLNI